MGLEACTFQVRDSQKIVRGTGFAISPNLIVTCAHVVNACKAKIGNLLSLLFYPEKIEFKAEVLHDGWNLEKDVAFLRLLTSLPDNAIHVGKRLGSFESENGIEKYFLSFGYPKIISDIKGFWARGLIVGQIRNDYGTFRLQLDSQNITFGMSGAPVMDVKSGLIVGMVQKTQISDRIERFRDLAYAIPIEVLCELSPDKLIINKISDRPSHYINMAPSFETGFIHRETEYEQLVEGLLNNQNDAPVAITTALLGAGGYGKTTLAKAICHDPTIKEKFSDGILWVTLGENPKNLIGHIQDLIYRLSDERPEFEGLDAATSYFRDLLQKKSLLLVIDDVWDSFHLEPFIQGGSECVRLITTRINAVLPEDTLEVRVDTMKNKEAVELLLTGFPCTDKKALDELAKRLGYWPLLLKIVNSALKQHVSRGKSFEEALEYVKNKLDRKKSLTAFDPRNPQKRNQAVEATISVSFDLLDNDEFERYKELAIFPEDEEIYLKTIEKLWGKTAGYDDFEVGDLCYKFFNLSLLQTYDEDKNFIKLHDVMREYLNSKQQQKTHLIHSQFLETYEVKTWADLPKEDMYIWKNLSYHLVKAGRKAELRELLLDFNWVQSKLNVTDTHFLITDYDHFPNDSPIQILKGAIQLSANALSKDKKLLGGQLLGRLSLFSENEIKLMLKYIRKNRSGIRILPITGSLTPPGGPLLRTLGSHSHKINTVSVTSDGKYAISGSDDNMLKVWDFMTGKELKTLTGHSGSVKSVSVTCDGVYAVSASRDKTIKVWNIEKGEEVRTLTGHFSSVNAVSITPDGNYAVSASDDETIKVWDIKKGKVIRTLTSDSNWPKAISITPDGKFAVSASWDNNLRLWDLKTGKVIQTLIGHSSFANAVSITPDGNYAISGSDDRTLKVWDIKTGKEIQTLTGHYSSVNAVSVTSDGNYAVSASRDNTLKVWDIETWKEIQTLTGHSGSVNAVSITCDKSYAVSASDDACQIPDSGQQDTRSYAVSASDDGTLKVWDIKTRKEVKTLTGHSGSVNAVSITPDGNYAVSASRDNTLKVWDIKTGEEIQTLTGHSDSVNGVSTTPDGNYAISGSDDRTLKVWDLKTGKDMQTSTGYFGIINKVSAISNEKHDVLPSRGKKSKVKGLKKEKKILKLKSHSRSVNAVSITPDGNYAVSASRDNTLKVWDIKTGTKIQTLTGHSDSVNGVFITPDGNYVVSASWDRTLKVWDIKTGMLLRTSIGHLSGVKAVSVTPDGKYTVSASKDNTLKIWDLKTGEEIQTLIGHSGSVNAVSITSDGNYAVSASSDSTLKVWDLRTNKEISAFIGDSSFLSVAFSPEGTTIVAGEANGRVHFLLFEKENENPK